MTRLFFYLIFWAVLLNNTPALAALSSSDLAPFPYINMLTKYNSSFENGAAQWTASGGSFGTTSSNVNTVYMGLGTANAFFDASASGQTLTSHAITVPVGRAGTNALYRCLVYNPNAATYTMGVWDGTTLRYATTISPLTGSAQYVEIAAPFGASATTTAIRFTAVAANEPSIGIKDCYIGPNFKLSDTTVVTAWQSYTPIFTNFGTSPSANLQWAQIGGSIHLRGTVTIGSSPPAAIASFSLPNGALAAVPVQQMVGQAGASFANATTWTAIAMPGSNSLFMGFQSSTGSGNATQSASTIGSGTFYFPDINVPILGLAGQSAVRMDQSDTNPATYTPSSYGGFTTVTTSSCKYSRVGPFMDWDCNFTPTAASGSAVAITLPNNLAVDNSYPAQTSVVGHCTEDLVQAVPLQLLGTGGSNTLGIGIYTTASDNPMVSMAGTRPTLARFSCHGFFAISGWGLTGRAPILVGGVTSSSFGAERVERVNSNNVKCTSSPCTVNATPGITSVPRTGTGSYTITFAAGIFSAVPTCVCGSNIIGSSGAICSIGLGSDTTTSVSFQTLTSNTVVADGSFNVICMGPR